ncbi:MAG TPA: bifunctional 3,4-dihydroxy-2-butanone-4-phosphate synthase/GTP cyclohydrolase II [Candidatus Omnitrophica bacterium]|nr:bifunctional 3,4-dihydroxy-2-butanone-4-phosphate synthase/GTP cyclohydrolase II [Candidatus Omnitrophota bacterium]HBQ38225.1 bifunctional 3,4-dihydroxy-2-butanone-4-phosphate synthase/GTP cyclohydrolase II [Candidatus Omnitrophota bacterium]
MSATNPQPSKQIASPEAPAPETSGFHPIPEILEELREGHLVIVVDDGDRENEGDLVMAASFVTPEHINFMAKFGRGIICVPMEAKRLDELDLHQMVTPAQDPMKTAWTISVDAAQGVTTGVSAHDRARTIQVLINPGTKPEDLIRPGHVFPLRAKEGGVLRRAGHTEAAVDLARLAGLYPAGVICEIMNDDGTMARTPQLFAVAKRHGLKICTIASLIEYRRRFERLVRRIVTTPLPTEFGPFALTLYETSIDERQHLALVAGRVDDGRPVLVRVHSQCLTGDVLHSLRCDCGPQLRQALRQIGQAGRGVLLYISQEGRGIGLLNKLKAYALQDQGLDTVEANQALGFEPDLRDYGIGAQILVDLGLKDLQLLTNNPRKIVGLEGYGLRVVERLPIEIPPQPANVRYLAAKRDKLGHLLNGGQA